MVSMTRMAAVSALALLAPALAAQSYDGWILVSTARTTEIPTPTNPFQGDGGLWFVHPLSTVAPVPVTGLGPELTGAGLPGPLVCHGANCVLRLPDGRVLVGAANGGMPVHLHVMTLAGAGVTSDQQIFCGTSVAMGDGGGIQQLARLPDGRILMALWGMASGPLGGADLGIADLAAGSVSTAPLTGTTGDVNALALDASGTQAFLGTTLGDVYSYDLQEPLSGAAVQVAHLPGTSVMNLALDNDGDLLIGCFYGDVVEFDPDTGSLTPLGLPTQVYNALTVERVTGTHIVVQHGSEAVVPITSWVARETGGSVSPLGGANWGLMTGMDVDPNPEAFGPATPGASTYTWSLAPSPGGLPVVGNPAFGLELVSSPVGWPGVLLVSNEALVPPVMVLGALLNVDPFKLVLPLFPLPALAGPQFIKLSIPPQPALVGADVFVQSGRLELGGVAASSGVKLTIL